MLTGTSRESQSEFLVNNIFLACSLTLLGLFESYNPLLLLSISGLYKAWREHNELFELCQLQLVLVLQLPHLVTICSYDDVERGGPNSHISIFLQIYKAKGRAEIRS